MRVLVFAPNGGASLSTGGGSRFVCRMAEVLASVYHHEVALAGYHSLSISELDGLHGTNLQSYGVRIETRIAQTSYRVFRSLPFKPSPYNILATPGFGEWCESIVSDSSPDVIWFSDDIPATFRLWKSSASLRLYVHFPVNARRTDVVPPLRKSRSLVEASNDAIIQIFGRRLIADPSEVDLERICCNSTVTQNVLRQVWGIPSRIVYNYVDEPEMTAPSPRNPRVISVGSFSQGKGFGTLIRAFAAARLEGWDLVIAGHARDPYYLHQLRRLVHKLGAEDVVHLRTDLPSAEIWSLLSTSSVVCSAAEFEPFGLSLLEGMSFGAVPITPQSEFSGGWMDVLERGRYGSGYSSQADLTGILQSLAARSLEAEARLVSDRSKSFSRARFVEELGRVSN